MFDLILRQFTRQPEKILYYLDITKAIALLDDAVGTPQPLLRSADKKTPAFARRARGK